MMKRRMAKRSGKERIYAAPANLVVPSSRESAISAGPRRRVYLDSTIPSVFFDQRVSLAFETEITKGWWHLETVNSRAGFVTPQIVTPLELFSESEEL